MDDNDVYAEQPIQSANPSKVYSTTTEQGNWLQNATDVEPNDGPVDGAKALSNQHLANVTIGSAAIMNCKKLSSQN